MTRIQRTAFIVGILAIIALVATIAGILLHRVFPHHPWVTIVAPLGAAGMVIALRRTLQGR